VLEDCELPVCALPALPELPVPPDAAPAFELELEPAAEPALAPDLELSLLLSEPEFVPEDASLPEDLAASPPALPAAAAAAEAATAASLVLLLPPLLSRKSVTYQPEPLS